MNPFLRWDNVSKFKGISSINVKPSKVWIPDIILYHKYVLSILTVHLYVMSKLANHIALFCSHDNTG
jgi:hypothetical protein